MNRGTVFPACGFSWVSVRSLVIVIALGLGSPTGAPRDNHNADLYT
jgi:hypothetical protein